MSAQRRPQDNGTTDTTATTARVSDPTIESLPELADWLAGISTLPIGQQRTATTAVLPLVQQSQESVREAWHAAIIDAGIWKPSTLGDKLAKLPAPPAGPPANGKNSSTAAKDDDSLPVRGVKDPWRYVPGKHVLDRNGRVVLSWCPTVTARFVTRDDNGEAVSNGTRFTVQVGDDTATVERGDLTDGSAWSRFPAAIGGSGRDVRDVLASIVEDQAKHLDETPTVPRWTDGRLILPPPRALATAGYLETAGEWDEWCALVKRTADAPKIALMLSMTVAGPFLSQLADVDTSPIFHANGLSSEGKGTAMKVCASVFGDPRRIIRPWGSTANGVLSYLREIGVFTGFRDELGANKSLRDPETLESTIFTITEGAERDLSSKTSRYRTPSGRWVGALMSTGNVDILGRIDNDAMLARVVQVSTPLTANGAQSREFKRVAARNYGHAIHRLAALKFTMDDFTTATEKALADIGHNTRGNGILDRHMEHLAHAVVGARLLEKMCGITDYADVVIKVSRQQMEIADLHLKEKGGQPYDRLWNLVHEFAQSKPAAVPTREEYLRQLTMGETSHVEVIGWNVSASQRVEAHYAIMPDALRKLANRGDLTDLFVAIKNGGQRRLLATNRRGEYKYNLRVGDEIVPTYALRAPRGVDGAPLAEATTGSDGDVTGASADVTEPVTGQVTPEVTASDQACYGSSGFSPDGSCKESEENADRLAAIITDESASLEARDAAAAALEALEKTPQQPAGQLELAPEGDHTRQGGSSPMRPSQAANRPRVSRIAANAQVNGPSEESAANWAKWLADDDTAAALKRAGISVTSELARRALVAFHRITDGLAWDATPGRVGRNLYARLRATHKNMPEVTPMTDERANAISTGKDVLLRLDFLNSGMRPEIGQSITSADVNNQFLSAAAMAVLGDGEPTVIKRVRNLSLILKDPGYVILSRALRIDDHPAFAGREIPAGTAIPMPMADYLTEWGVTLPVKEAIVWGHSGQRLNKHATKLKEFLTEARKWKNHADPEVSAAAQIVEIAVKDIYAVTYGGQLRSERYAGELLRRDWSDMIVSLAYANALRGLDRAAYGIPALNPETGKRNPYRLVTEARAAGQPMGDYALGLIKDTAYFLHDNDTATLPECLEVPENRQFGKWRLERHVTVTDTIHAAYGNGITALRKAINDEWKAGQE